jgi:hypothetical protein
LLLLRTSKLDFGRMFKRLRRARRISPHDPGAPRFAHRTEN